MDSAPGLLASAPVVGVHESSADFSRFPFLPPAAEVTACDEIGHGCNVAEGAKVKNRGIVPPQTIFYGDRGLVTYDPSAMVVSERAVTSQSTRMRWDSVLCI